MREVRVTRHIEQLVETVFDAWLDEMTAGEWLFGTPGGRIVRVEIDAEVGGRFEIVENRDGEDVLHTGTYEVIERPSLLVFTLQVPKYSPNSERVRIEFSPAEEGCEIVLAQTVSDGAPASPEQIERGWRTILDTLAWSLEARGEEG